MFKVKITDTINKINDPLPKGETTKHNYNYNPNNNWFVKWTEEGINGKLQETRSDKGDKEKLRIGEGVYLDYMLKKSLKQWLKNGAETFGSALLLEIYLKC